MAGYVVLTTMKNEGAFLLEWVAHHVALGFDQLVICTNDCEDPTDEMVARLQVLGLARHHPTRTFPDTSIQRVAFRQAARLPEVAQADWLWVCDADEFLVVHAGDGTVQALVAAGSAGVEVISVPWRVFGSAGIEGYDAGLVTRSFTRAQAPAARGQGGPVFAKSLTRDPERAARIGVHAPIAPESLGRPYLREGPGGRLPARGGQPMMIRADYRVAQVNHYALRSLDSFLVKRDRGRVNHVGQDMGLEYWRRFDLNSDTCVAIRRYDTAADQALSLLMRDPHLAVLHAQAVAWHRARIAACRARPDMQALVAAVQSLSPAESTRPRKADPAPQ